MRRASSDSTAIRCGKSWSSTPFRSPNHPLEERDSLVCFAELQMQLTSHFYAMVDAAGGHDPVALAEILLDGGVTLMQLRLKEASSRDFLAAARTIARLC